MRLLLLGCIVIQLLWPSLQLDQLADSELEERIVTLEKLVETRPALIKEYQEALRGDKISKNLHRLIVRHAQKFFSGISEGTSKKRVENQNVFTSLERWWRRWFRPSRRVSRKRELTRV